MIVKLVDANPSSGNEGEFYAENGEIARHFGGVYTIREIEVLLADMKELQLQYNAGLIQYTNI